MIRPFLIVGVVAVQGQAPVENNHVGADGLDFLVRALERVPFVKGFRDQRAIDEQPRFERIVL